MATLRSKWIAALRGGEHPRGVALAVGLGLVAGFASGVNLTFAALLWLALVLNVRTTIFAFTWAIGVALAVVGHSICHGTGYALLDELRLGEWIALLGESPIVALLDWDRYALVGGVTIAIVLAVPAARGAWTLADSRWRSLHEGQPPRQSLMRPLSWLFAPIAAVPLVFLPWALVEQQLADEILDDAVAFSDCTASADQAKLCLLTGDWSADNVTIVRRAQPDRPVLRVERVQAKLNSSRLLRGWLHVDDLKLSGVTRVDHVAPSTTQPAERPATHDTLPGGAVLDEMLIGWRERRDWLAWSADALGMFDQLAGHDQQQTHTAPSQLFGALVATLGEPRSRLGRRQPRVIVNRVQVVDLAPSWHLGAKAALEIVQLNSNPRLAVYPTTLKVTAPEWSTTAELTLNLAESGQRHQLKLRAVDMPLAELLDPAATRSRLVVQRGLVSATGEGWLDAQRVHLPLTLEVQQLAAQVLGSVPVAGVSTESWNRGLRELGGLRTESLVSGRWENLHLTLDPQETIKQLQHQLRSAGAHELVATIEQEAGGQRGALVATPVNATPGDRYPTTTTAVTAGYPSTATSEVNNASPEGVLPAMTVVAPSDTGLQVEPVSPSFAPVAPAISSQVVPASNAPAVPTPADSAPSAANHVETNVRYATTATADEPAVSPNPYLAPTAANVGPTPAPLDDAAPSAYPTANSQPTVPTASEPTPTEAVSSVAVSEPGYPTALASDAPQTASPVAVQAPVAAQARVTPPAPKPMTARISAPPVPAGPPISPRTVYTTGPNGVQPQGASPGPINMPTGPDMDGLYARGQVNGAARPTLPPTAPSTATINKSEPTKPKSGFAQWTESVGKSFNGMFSRSKEPTLAPSATVPASTAPTATPQGASVARSTPVPRSAVPNATAPKSSSLPAPQTGGTSFASDAPGAAASGTTASKSWFDRFKR